MEAFKTVQNILKTLIENNELERAFDLMREHVAPISQKLDNSIVLNLANYNSILEKRISGLITEDNAGAQMATTKMNLLSIMNKVPNEMKIQELIGKIKPGIYSTSALPVLEKIQGGVNNLVNISWLDNAKEKSKSVCQVVRSDGKKGTGFVMKGGYLMTNFHVLPNAERASSAKIVFDYETDLHGHFRKTSEFSLDGSSIKISPINEYDFAYVRIIDNPGNPLSQWGYLEPETFYDPQPNDPVTIIQHPKGGVKQIALTANKVISIFGNKLMYETDTEPGSSGSPVFNNDWKVVALHHAGKSDDDGGLVINESGERRGANEGILMKPILDKLSTI